jgi:hypothetical protein
LIVASLMKPDASFHPAQISSKMRRRSWASQVGKDPLGERERVRQHAPAGPADLHDRPPGLERRVDRHAALAVGVLLKLRRPVHRRERVGQRA